MNKRLTVHLLGAVIINKARRARHIVAPISSEARWWEACIAEEEVSCVKDKNEAHTVAKLGSSGATDYCYMSAPPVLGVLLFRRACSYGLRLE